MMCLPSTRGMIHEAGQKAFDTAHVHAKAKKAACAPLEGKDFFSF